MSAEKTYKAAMIVIGNEILSGRTQDKNVQYVGQSLTEKGIYLSEVRVVPDVE
ncbi:MAG: molybdopterin-binding protein, partial [Bdellovibrionales bacterium]